MHDSHTTRRPLYKAGDLLVVGAALAVLAGLLLPVLQLLR
jgi:hypothetical protein